MNITDDFVNYLFEINRHIPERVLEKARVCFLDFLGVAFAGAKENKKICNEYVFSSVGNSTVLGWQIKTDSLTAAFLNGYNAHTVELDDGSRFGMIHLGATIIPAVLAVAEERQLQFENVLCGIIMGYEAAVRVAISIQPGHKKRGFHTSGTCGTIGASVGVGFAMGYNKEDMKRTICASATSAAGLLEIQEGASQLKPYNIAHAAMAGIAAARIGKCKLDMPDDILTGSRGMLRILSNTFVKNKLLNCADYYEIERIYIKPYAACRHCHPAIEAILSIANNNNILPEEILRIKIYIYEMAINGHDHKIIQGTTSAKLSMPYSIAVACIRKSCGLEDFEKEVRENQKILQLIKKVDIIPKKEFTDCCPEKRISEVHVVTTNNEYKCRVDYAKGEPENPLSDNEIMQKFYDLMRWSGQDKKGKQIINLFSDSSISIESLGKILNQR